MEPFLRKLYPEREATPGDSRKTNTRGRTIMWRTNRDKQLAAAFMCSFERSARQRGC
jgi:hypothetical protein